MIINLQELYVLLKSILFTMQLKNLVVKTEKTNEVCKWYVPMVCYHVYVLLLLLGLSNVEKIRVLSTFMK